MDSKEQEKKFNYKKAISMEGFMCISLIVITFSIIGNKMGGVNMVNTMLNTAYALLVETVWYIMAIAVVAGAAISLVPAMVSEGLVRANDIAVFTAMCMCWSGYLSTHVAMMDSLNERKLTGTAIMCHTIGGLCAGISANIIYHVFRIVFL